MEVTFYIYYLSILRYGNAGESNLKIANEYRVVYESSQVMSKLG